MQRKIKARQRLGKYRIDRKLGDGGFATVYKAMDTIEGVWVALKITHEHLVTTALLDDIRNEVLHAARLKHSNILPLKNADIIDGRFVMAYPLGERSLADRLQSRLSLATSLDFAGQMLAAAACAHEHRIIHCDIKPDNFIIFSDGRLMLTDFGIAKVALRTVRASGSGTIGYCAPEQAMGKPSFRSDVFSLGLVLYRMLAGQLPEWPFQWPPPAYARLRKRVHADIVALVRRAIEVDPRRRFAHAGAMLAALRRIKSPTPGNRSKPRPAEAHANDRRDWRTVRWQQFQRKHGKALATRFECTECQGPVSESMAACPWCGSARGTHSGATSFPLHCPRCNRGLKLDWKYCPWCYGAGFAAHATREYTDGRYVANCTNTRCTRRRLMPFMRYCPWCRRKVRRNWKVEGSSDKCPSCNWGVVVDFWSYCPWCGKSLKDH